MGADLLAALLADVGGFWLTLGVGTVALALWAGSN